MESSFDFCEGKNLVSGQNGSLIRVGVQVLNDDNMSSEWCHFTSRTEIDRCVQAKSPGGPRHAVASGEGEATAVKMIELTRPPERMAAKERKGRKNRGFSAP